MGQGDKGRTQGPAELFFSLCVTVPMGAFMSSSLGISLLRHSPSKGTSQLCPHVPPALWPLLPKGL